MARVQNKCVSAMYVAIAQWTHETHSCKSHSHHDDTLICCHLGCLLLVSCVCLCVYKCNTFKQAAHLDGESVTGDEVPDRISQADCVVAPPMLV